MKALHLREYVTGIPFTQLPVFKLPLSAVGEHSHDTIPSKKNKNIQACFDSPPI